MRHIHRLLQQCLDQAMRDGLISDNPARAFHYSKPKKVNADVLTPLEMETIWTPPSNWATSHVHVGADDRHSPRRAHRPEME